MTADRQVTMAGRDGDDLTRTREYPALRGLWLAADSLEGCMRELGAAAQRTAVDVQRLCAASFSAGRLVGYMEALAATDAGLARQAALELGDVVASVDEVRRRFESVP